MDELKRTILVVDHEAAIRDSLLLLLRDSFQVQVAQNGEEALEIVSQAAPDLVVLDLMMPNVNGIEVLKRLRERGDDIPVVMLTASGTIKSAVEAMRFGAKDVLSKPFDAKELTSAIVSALDEHRTKKAVENAEGMPAKPRTGDISGDFGPMVGRAASMIELFRKVEHIATRDSTVLITGESGTGKELVAHQIHELSGRKGKPFVALNCAAIPESLIESELFGHEKGAFTHAVDRRLGHFELANGGTLFLDEIGELSPAVQVKLLRFLQEQEFYRVGRSKPIQVDVRVVTATNKNLEQLVEAGQFRQDLYYRINVIQLALPALRERYDDIAPLAEFFVQKLAPRYGGRIISFGADALGCLATYSWPGNVRELENVIESLIALSAHEEIQIADLPRKIRDGKANEAGPTVTNSSALGFEEAERIFETEMIVKALRRANFVQTRAAEMLGISRRILKYKMDKLRIDERGEVAASGEVAAEDRGKSHL